VNGKRQTNQIRFSPPQYKAKYYSDPRLKEHGLTNSTIDVSGRLLDCCAYIQLVKTCALLVLPLSGFMCLLPPPLT
jgi:hypothetical protein